jgi:hypothetical protein
MPSYLTAYEIHVDVLVSRAIGLSCFGSNEAHDLWLFSLRGGLPVEKCVFCGSSFEGRLDFVSSFFAGGQDHPDAAYLFGLSGGLKYEFTRPKRWRPYVLGHVGVAATDIGEPDLSGIFQFNEQCGLGLKYRLSGKQSILAEVSYLHVSNGGISEPNHGLNAALVTVGYGFEF